MKRNKRSKRASPAQATDPLAHLYEVKAKYEAALLDKANVVAVGIGIPMHDGQPTGPPGIIVSVTQKVSAQELDEADLVPQELESVPVWVEAIDQPHAADATDAPQDAEDACPDEGMPA
jgi:hypothetical protein